MNLLLSLLCNLQSISINDVGCKYPIISHLYPSTYPNRSSLPSSIFRRKKRKLSLGCKSCSCWDLLHHFPSLLCLDLCLTMLREEETYFILHFPWSSNKVFGRRTIMDTFPDSTIMKVPISLNVNVLCMR